MLNKTLIIAVAICLILTGCGASTTDQSTMNTSETQSQAGSTAAATDDTIDILGGSYIFGISETLTKGEETLTATAIADSGIYYAHIGGEQAPTGTLYGVTPMTYYDYYASEIGVRSTDALAENSPAEIYKKAGAYDAITSATSLPGSHSDDYPTILAYTPGTDIKNDPLMFNGIKKVDIAVDAQQYIEGKILAKATGDQYALARAVVDIVLNDDPTVPQFNNNVKMLGVDGLYGKSSALAAGSDAQDLSAISALSEVVYNSRYGNYLFRISLDGFDTEDSNSELYLIDYLSNLYAATIENSNGDVAGTLYYQDTWVEPGRSAVEIAVSSGHVSASHGYEFDVNRFDELFTKGTIDMPVGDYKLVLKSRGYQDIITKATVGKRLADEQHIVIEDQIWQDVSNTLAVDGSMLPTDFEVQSYKLLANRNEMVEGDDYSFDKQAMTLVVHNTENAGVNDYQFTVYNNNYQPAEAVFTLKSTMRADQLQLVDNQLVMASDSPISLQDYLTKVSRAYVWDTEGGKDNALRMRLSNGLFTEDNILDSAVEYRERPVFESGKTYTIRLTAPGYEDVIFTDITIE